MSDCQYNHFCREWAVILVNCSFQAHADDKLAKTMYLPLAERMAKKYVDQNKIEAEAEVLLYIIILELLGKHQEVLDLIESPLGGLCPGKYFSSLFVCGV